ncbi:hypothetical protein QUA82_26910 [Microcoleus sp. F8-D3]
MQGYDEKYAWYAWDERKSKQPLQIDGYGDRHAIVFWEIFRML